MPVNGPTAKSYPSEEQYASWKEQADELDMTVSEFISTMVEAGRKKFDVRVEPDETISELRTQRNDLKRELQHARSRIGNLEDKLHRTERRAIVEYVEENPGCTWDQVIQHLLNTVDQRAINQLDALEGKHIRRDADDRFYPISQDGDSG